MLYECPVHHPDGAVQGAGDAGGLLVVGGLGRVLIPEGLDSGQQEDEHPHDGDGGRDAGPHRQVKGREE